MEVPMPIITAGIMVIPGTTDTMEVIMVDITEDTMEDTMEAIIPVIMAVGDIPIIVDITTGIIILTGVTRLQHPVTKTTTKRTAEKNTTAVPEEDQVAAV